MKKTGLLIAVALFAFVFIKCKKSSDSPKLTYIVNGFTDVNVRQYADTTFYLPVIVEFQSGTQEPVTLTPSGMPTGITASPTTISGTPTYNTVIQFNVKNVAPGSYPVTITSSSASTSKKSYTFNVIVNASPDCASILVGSYKAKNACAPTIDTNGFNANIITTGNANQLYIPLDALDVYVDVNCSAGTLTIVPRSTSYYSISNGTGTITSNTIVLNYTIVENFTHTTSTCTTTYTRR